MQRGITCVLVPILLALSLGLPARAGDKAEAKRHFKSGLKLMEAEDYNGAVAEFEAAVAGYPTKNGLFNLANAYKALHRYEEALATLERLKSEFGDQLGDRMSGAVVRQEGSIRAVTAELEILVEPAGASIAVDGRPVGASPLPRSLLLGPGDHSVEAALEGYRTARRQVKLVTGQKATEAIALEPLPPAHEVGLPVESTVPDEATSPAPPAVSAAPAGPGALGVLKWVSLALAIGGGAATGALVYLGEERYGDFRVARSRYQDLAIGEDDAAITSAKNDVETYDTAALATGVCAGAFAAAAIAFFIADAVGQKPAEVEVAAAPGGLLIRY